MKKIKTNLPHLDQTEYVCDDDDVLVFILIDY